MREPEWICCVFVQKSLQVQRPEVKYKNARV